MYVYVYGRSFNRTCVQHVCIQANLTVGRRRRQRLTAADMASLTFDLVSGPTPFRPLSFRPLLPLRNNLQTCRRLLCLMMMMLMSS